MKTILYIEKNPFVLDMIYSVTEFYCKSHFSAISRDNFRAYIFAIFYILLTVHLEVILDNNQLDALFLNVFISCLYTFRATSAHHQEDHIVLIHHLV